MTRYTAIDLTQLPPPEAIEQLDYETILEAMRQQLNGATAVATG